MRKQYLFLCLILFLISTTGLIYAAPVKDEPATATSPETAIKKWGLTYTLPSDKWTLADFEEDPNLKRAIFVFKREAIIDGQGMAVIPNIAFIFEGLDQKMDVVTFSKEMRFRMGDKFGTVKRFFVRDDEPQLISLKNAVGYICEGKDSKDMNHTIIWVHTVNKQIGLQVLMDVSAEVYPAVKGEFEATMRSLRDV